MKKITIDASSILPIPGRRIDGISRTTLELIKAFSMMDLPFELKLFTQRLRGDRLQQYNFGFPTCHLPLPRWNSVNKLTQRFPIIETLCKSHLYHVPRNYAPYNHLDRTIITIHDVMFFAYPEKQFIKNNLAQKVPPIANKCKAIITCSDNSKKDIIKYMDIDPQKIHVIPWGIDHKFFTPTDDTSFAKKKIYEKFSFDKPFFFSVSCDIGRKNTPKLIDEYLRFAENDTHHDLFLVWSKPPEEIFQKLKSSPHGKKVHIVPSVSDEELRDLYRASTALVFPSLYEGFGLPVLEAMACGTAVITTPFSSLPEVGGDAAYYIDPNNENSIYDALMAFEKETVDRSALVQKGLDHVKNFTWEKCARKTIDVYMKVLGE